MRLSCHFKQFLLSFRARDIKSQGAEILDSSTCVQNDRKGCCSGRVCKPSLFFIPLSAHRGGRGVWTALTLGGRDGVGAAVHDFLELVSGRGADDRHAVGSGYGYLSRGVAGSSWVQFLWRVISRWHARTASWSSLNTASRSSHMIASISGGMLLPVGDAAVLALSSASRSGFPLSRDGHGTMARERREADLDSCASRDSVGTSSEGDGRGFDIPGVAAPTFAVGRLFAYCRRRG